MLEYIFYLSCFLYFLYAIAMILRNYDFRSPLQDTIGLIIRIFICIVLLYALVFNTFFIFWNALTSTRDRYWSVMTELVMPLLVDIGTVLYALYRV